MRILKFKKQAADEEQATWVVAVMCWVGKGKGLSALGKRRRGEGLQVSWSPFYLILSHCLFSCLNSPSKPPFLPEIGWTSSYFLLLPDPFIFSSASFPYSTISPSFAGQNLSFFSPNLAIPKQRIFISFTLSHFIYSHFKLFSLIIPQNRLQYHVERNAVCLSVCFCRHHHISYCRNDSIV